MTSMGWWKRAFKPYNGAEPDPRPSRQDILGVDQCFECSNPRAAARLHPRGNGPAVRHRPCQHPWLSGPERGAHHPPATPPEPSCPERGLHQRQRLQNSRFPRSIPPPLYETRRVQRDPIVLPARMPEPGRDWGEESILVLMPSQGRLPVPQSVPQPESPQVAGTGRDQAQWHDHRLQAPPAPGEDNASTTGNTHEQADADQEWAAPPSSTRSRKRSRLACSSFVTIPPRMVGSINGAKTPGSS